MSSIKEMVSMWCLVLGEEGDAVNIFCKRIMESKLEEVLGKRKIIKDEESSEKK